MLTTQSGLGSIELLIENKMFGNGFNLDLKKIFSAFIKVVLW